MPLSLHAVIIPSYLQTLGSVQHLIGKAEAWCVETGTAPAALIEERLAPDMHPFGYQVKSVAVHSQGAIEGVQKGVFSPDSNPWPESFDGLRERIAKAQAVLEATDPATLESLIGRDMRFEAGERRMDFVAEDFLLSFSRPNFYFHTAAAYAILRMKGLNIGKRDYIGALPLKV